MTYAHPGHARGSDRPVVGSSGWHVPGCHGGTGRAHRIDRATVDHGSGDRQRSRYAIAGDGAANTADWADRIRFHHGAFGSLAEAVEQAGFEKVDGLLADLGVSRYQLTAPDRGFSFMADGPLDMRMDQSIGTTAADLVNHTDEKTLADLIYQLGEERRARKIARAIVRARPIRSTLHLADVVERAVPRTGRLHPATKTFMALRMAVNDEPEELDRLLEIGPRVAEERRADGGDQLHVQRRPEGEGKVPGAGTREGRATIAHQTSAAADRRRECVQPGIAQRKAAGAGND